ncbi:uridylate kinase [Lasallia pustulata]|uniref:Uridylate kinase n=1 Tax=Lasallia pustulata TaxID=136370 RepID=A0A1W5D764_9LECA|nr:uridylate kinase [Lasallia pustulata]
MPLHRTVRSSQAALRNQFNAKSRLTHPRARDSIFQLSTPRRTYGSGPNPTPGRSPLKVWPFIAITLVGTGSYTLMKSPMPAIAPPKSHPQISSPAKDTPTFSPDNVSVIFVLGGPGSGKGTQCEKIVRDYGFTHLSAGDLLRAEQDRPDSEFGNMIKEYIRDGKIVPMEVTVQLLENAMTEDIKQHDGKGKFLIDGFPRKMDQALHFEASVCPSKSTLFFDCPEDVMLARLLNRGKTSGRTDDNEESIKKRFKTFVDTSMPVVDYFETKGKLVKILAVRSPDEVYQEVRRVLRSLGF